jgi:hypothetical protein
MKAASWNLLYRKRKESDRICNTRKKRKLKYLLMKRKTLRTLKKVEGLGVRFRAWISFYPIPLP